MMPSNTCGRITAVNPDQPWFIYYVPGGVHAPHYPTPEWDQEDSDHWRLRT
jgi:hypothetical protein